MCATCGWLASGALWDVTVEHPCEAPLPDGPAGSGEYVLSHCILWVEGREFLDRHPKTGTLLRLGSFRGPFLRNTVDNSQKPPPGPGTATGTQARHSDPGASIWQPPSMTPAQKIVFKELFAIGSQRPIAPAGLAEDLRRHLNDSLAPVVARWNGRSLWVGKSQLATVMRCEGQFAADAAEKKGRAIGMATAVGVVVHRAIQLSHTHPDRTCDQYIQAAIQGSRAEESFESFWQKAPEYAQSDLIAASVSRLVSYLDSVPPLQPTWTPRFEEPIAAKIGSLTLAAKPDLVLGRPRADGRQTMLLCDMKSTDLRDYHHEEAMFYALIATLRYGCPPFRSCVLSLSSMEWTEPDVTKDLLFQAANRVTEGVTKIVDVLTEARGASLVPGRHCGWCPGRDTCPSREAWQLAGSPEDPTPFAISAVPVTVPEPPVEIVSVPAPAASPDDPWAL